MAESNKMREMPEKVQRICKLYNVTEAGNGRQLYIVFEQLGVRI